MFLFMCHGKDSHNERSGRRKAISVLINRHIVILMRMGQTIDIGVFSYKLFFYFIFFPRLFLHRNEWLTEYIANR